MAYLSDFPRGSVIYHSTPSGIQYIGVVAGTVDDKLLECWWWMPAGENYDGYWAHADASPERVTFLGQLPEGLEWDVE